MRKLDHDDPDDGALLLLDFRPKNANRGVTAPTILLNKRSATAVNKRNVLRLYAMVVIPRAGMARDKNCVHS